MSEEGFEEEWDADFVDQLIQAEELALSTSASQNPNPTSISTAFASHFAPPPSLQKPLNVLATSYDHFTSYSPPRVLSQRISNTDTRSSNYKDLEIERLKKELGRVSKQLTELEQECSELRKQRNQNEAQIQYVYPHNKEKNADVLCLKNTNLKYGVPNATDHGDLWQFQSSKALENHFGAGIDATTSSCKAAGVQTNFVGDVSDGQSPLVHLSKKLQCIWGSPSEQNLGRNLISKLFVDCPTDFQVLFRCMGTNTSSMVRKDSLADETSSDLALQYHMYSFRSFEATKATRLYSVLSKVSHGMLQLEALFETLLELCHVENVIIVHRSLRILRVLLKHLLSLEKKSEERDNVMVEALGSGSTIEDLLGSESNKVGGLFSVSSPFRISSVAETSKKKEYSAYTSSFSYLNWVSLFEFVYQIVLRNIDEAVRLEAVSVMNLILMRSNGYEREGFGKIHVLESLPQLLRKDSGVRLQKEALYFLYLLINCPKILAYICSSCKGGENACAVDGDGDNSSTCKGFGMILEGLADCMSCCGNGVQHLELRRIAVIVLAFLASTGKSGFEILVNYKLSREANFLALILQVVMSEMDMETAVCNESVETYKVRTLLLRESLILLNRLVSSPAYSATVLVALTNSRDMATLTTDIANRLSQKEHSPGHSDPMVRHMRKSEIIDLARVFKKRVFTYLGDHTNHTR